MITLVLGGVRSGKSEVAEALLQDTGVTYLATGQPVDDEMRARIAAHRLRRPPSWRTVEEAVDLVGALAEIRGPVLLDSLGTWVANTLDEEPDVGALVRVLVDRPSDTVLVSEEVGMGVHPLSPSGRRFADRLGEVNRQLATAADRCLLVVAGRTIDLT